MLCGFTTLVAAKTDTPEFEIDQSECDKIAERIQNVARHYSIEATQKSIDITALIGTLGAVVGVRVAAYNIRKKVEAEERRAAQPGPPNAGNFHVLHGGHSLDAYGQPIN